MKKSLASTKTTKLFKLHGALDVEKFMLLPMEDVYYFPRNSDETYCTLPLKLQYMANRKIR